MKPLLMIALILSATTAFADSFKLTRDGQEYLCTATAPTTPGGAVDCVNKAYSGPFSRDESMRLCSGARSTAPAECAMKAYAGPLSKEESINLCIHARSTGPVDCVSKAYAGPFSKAESLDLCSGDTSVATADCAIKAYAGPYSKAESIRLCKGEPQLMMRSLKLMEKSQEIQQKVMQMKVTYPVLRQ
ncbi:MAG: hypothetical protein JSU04_16195 [Bdellovibrionales bacterium]|nr:hypothetical protein [Bdellovibrionales bacterium]